MKRRVRSPTYVSVSQTLALEPKRPETRPFKSNARQEQSYRRNLRQHRRQPLAGRMIPRQPMQLDGRHSPHKYVRLHRPVRGAEAYLSGSAIPGSVLSLYQASQYIRQSPGATACQTTNVVPRSTTSRPSTVSVRLYPPYSYAVSFRTWI